MNGSKGGVTADTLKTRFSVLARRGRCTVPQLWRSRAGEAAWSPPITSPVSTRFSLTAWLGGVTAGARNGIKYLSQRPAVLQPVTAKGGCDGSIFS